MNNAASRHPFDRAIALEPQGRANADGSLTYRGHTSPAYANMVGPFGGITAAQALQSVMLHPQLLGEPVAFTGNFAAAMRDGEFIVQATPARTNRSTQHWTITIRQADDQGDRATVFTATVLTARRRDTWGAVDVAVPEAPTPQNSAAVPALRELPEWFKRYEMRWVRGIIPDRWDGTESDSTSTLWARDELGRPLDFPALLAMCDVFYPRVWLRRAKRVPAGTVSMTVYFHVDAAGLADSGTGHVLCDARGQGFFGGFFDQAATLWSEQRRLLASSHQVVYYRE